MNGDRHDAQRAECGGDQNSHRLSPYQQLKAGILPMNAEQMIEHRRASQLNDSESEKSAAKNRLELRRAGEYGPQPDVSDFP
jgi:hypothetical protein